MSDKEIEQETRVKLRHLRLVQKYQQPLRLDMRQPARLASRYLVNRSSSACTTKAKRASRNPHQTDNRPP